MPSKRRYEMRIERTIVDKLGLNMYDKVSAAVAEIVANSYDADAENVTVEIPLGKALATRKDDGTIDEKGYEIKIVDNGYGMTPEEANDLYLRVGRDRRDERGDKSREKGRPVMGRRGIGKLAPFGICKTIVVRSAGGKLKNGKFEVSHFKIEYEDIMRREKGDKGIIDPYYPDPLEDDGTYDTQRGTIITLKNFYAKRVPDRDTFARQLSYKFAQGLKDFQVTVIDVKKESPADPFTLEEVPLPIEEETRVDASETPVEDDYGIKYTVSGWIAMSKKPYKDEFGGVRIYVRGKCASITRDFGLPAGFTGEFVARSYLVGEIHADWLDDEEDLIQTHRQDILWDSKLGQALQKWGKEIVKQVAKKGKGPRRKKVSDLFLEKSKIGEKAKERYKNESIQEAAVELGKRFGQFAHEDELEDEDYVEDFSNFILDIAPHQYLVDTFHKIREKAKDGKIDMKELIELFRATHIAELTSFGQIANEKVHTIDVLEERIRGHATQESDLQKILETAPWLINPIWQPITTNQQFKTFRSAFEKWYEREHKVKITTSTQISGQTKRPDFIMMHKNNAIRVIEIKPPGHTFDTTDFDRFNNYVDSFEEFFNKHPSFKDDFPNTAKFTVVTDRVNLDSKTKKAWKSLMDDGTIEACKSWEELLRDTKQFHHDFLEARDKFQEIEI